MDLDGYWQENKRFVLSVGAGAVLFLVGFVIESSIYRDELVGTQREIQGFKNQLASAPFTAQDLAAAESENEALHSAEKTLAEAARFHPRPEFVPDPNATSAAHHYLRTLARVREDLTQRANRAGLELDSSLGMPELSPTDEGEIVRYLEALDLIESVADLAIRARADRIEKIQVRLDPGHGSRQGVGPIERTRITLNVSGTSLSVTSLLVWSQRPAPDGRVLPIEQLEMSPAKGKQDEVRLEVSFVVARVRDAEPVEAEG
jgi:hypothetical protein